jgi:serine/threonine protein kinase
MADVLLGVAPGTRGFNKLLVIKRLRQALSSDPSMVSMFLDEARLAARLSHTNLVHTFEIGEEAGGYFIVMEYLDGRPVSQIFDALRETGTRLPPEVWAKVMSEALAGLQYAHELCDYDGVPLNVVHRDVSPQNILVTFDGEVKLVDFGIAKASVNVTETETGILKGKLAYMAPEQARFGVPIDRRADVFSTGVVLWECLAMTRLITGDAVSAAKKLQDMTFPPPSSENPAVPPELDAITMRALERDPAARYQTAEAMRTALEGYLRGSGHYVQERDIGAPIAKLFSEQREDVRAQIRMHMANLRSERAVSEAAAGDKLAPAAASSEPSGDVEWPTEVASLPRIEVTESARSVRAVQKTTQPTRGPIPRPWQLTAALAVGLVALVAIASGRFFAPRHAAPASLVSGAASAPSAAPSSPPVHVEIHAIPPEATITLDDAPLTNPFSGSFARDGLEHRLQVAREGYGSEGRLLRFDGDDVNLGIVLAPVFDAGAPLEARPPRSFGGAGPRRPGKERPRLDKDPYQ